MPESPANVMETSALPDDIRESVAVANLKTISEQGAILTNMALTNLVAHQQRLNQIAEEQMQGSAAFGRAILSRAINHVLDTEIADAAAVQKIASGNDLGQQLAQLGAVISQIMQTVKTAQTTPPVTAGA